MIRLLGNSLTAVAGNSLTAEDGQTYHVGPRVHKSHSYQSIGGLERQLILGGWNFSISVVWIL